MKIGIVGDIHWSTYSSILRSRGKDFFFFFEGLIKSLDWAEQLFKEQGCEQEVFLGDFFDKSVIEHEEATALKQVKWNEFPCITKRHFIVGNHEVELGRLEYSSLEALSLVKNHIVYNEPTLVTLGIKTQALFLPYIVEDNRKPLEEYLKDRDPSKKLVIFSHNDIKNFQMGQFLSKTGFDIEDIEKNCDLYLNGHLHNCGKVTNKIINVGVLSGCNFSEDAFKYEHHVAILDTETLEIQYFENPYAFNWYKIDINSSSDLNELNEIKDNAIVCVRCKKQFEADVKDALGHLTNVLTYKIICTRDLLLDESSEELKFDMGKDHIEQFREYILKTLGNSSIVNEELGEVCK